MTSAVGTVGLTQNAPQQQAPAAAGSPLSASSFASTAAAANGPDTKPLTGNPNAPISPRIVVDPLAGVITQFLSTTGQVESQIPSAAVVAYLRAGLTSDGRVKQTPETESQSSKNDTTVLA